MRFSVFAKYIRFSYTGPGTSHVTTDVIGTAYITMVDQEEPPPLPPRRATRSSTGILNISLKKWLFSNVSFAKCQMFLRGL